MNCADCGRPNRPDSRFCLGCGATLSLRCEGCQRPLPPIIGLATKATVVGVATAVVMLLIDALFFESVSLPGISSAVNLPIPVRVVLPVYAAVTEETIYWLGIMTGVVSYSMRNRSSDNRNDFSISLRSVTSINVPS